MKFRMVEVDIYFSGNGGDSGERRRFRDHSSLRHQKDDQYFVRKGMEVMGSGVMFAVKMLVMDEGYFRALMYNIK